MSKIAINTTNKEVISVSAKKAIPLAIKQATGASGGGGGSINITPYITMDGSSVVFNYFTPKQMAEVYIWLEGGNLWFELTKDEEGQYSLTTKCDIQELDGMFIVGGEEFIVNTIVDSFIVDLKGYKVSEVRIEGIDADLLDADFTWKLAEISNKLNGVAQESTSQEILERVGNSNGALQSLADSWNAMVVERNKVDGFKFVDDRVAYSIEDVIFNMNKLVEIDTYFDGHEITTFPTFFLTCIEKFTIRGVKSINSASSTGFFFGTGGNTNIVIKECYLPDIEEIKGDHAFYSAKNLVRLEMPKLIKVSGSACLGDLPLLKELILPVATSLGSNQILRRCTALQKLHIPNIKSIPTNFISNESPNLIDLMVGTGFNGNFSLAFWGPANALSAESISLIEEGENFSSNLEKLLYNIREHIAALLVNRTGLSSFTITFHANVKAAILADQETADAFTNKGWTIA